MINNYLKTAWRSLLKNRFFSLLNIFGLAISVCMAILLVSYGRHELNYDQYISKKDQLYRVIMEANEKYNYEHWAELPNAVGSAMRNDIPEVQAVARLVQLDFTGFASIRAKEHNFIDKRVFLADSTFFSLFDLSFVEGAPQHAFSNPKSVVISRSTKANWFGDEPALHQKIVLNQRDTMTITGVYEDLPASSSLDISVLLNFKDSWMGRDEYWSNASYQTFCLLQAHSDPEAVSKKATALIDKYVPKDQQYYQQFILQPLTDIHLHSSGIRDTLISKNGSMSKVNTVFILALLILVIACINYMNLATARSQKNAKEVGINKVLGANTYQIRVRFFLETALLSTFAILLGWGLALISLPLFNNIAHTDLQINTLLHPSTFGIAIGIGLLVTLLGGSYPAFYMSKIKSLSLMRKAMPDDKASQFLRQGLVVFQFACSIILTIGVCIISLQMRYVTQKDLGYQPSHIAVIPIQSIKSSESYNAIKEDILQLAGTASVATVQTFPGYSESGKTIQRPGTLGEGLPVSTSSSRGPVAKTLGMHLLAGSDLPDQLSATDTTAYLLINEVVSAYLGYADPKEAVGQSLMTEVGPSTIVGVVRNFNFESLKSPISGYVYYRTNRPSENYRYLLAHYTTANTSEYIQRIEQIYARHQPDAAFDYQFLDDYIQQYYTEENQTNRVVSVFSLLTVMVACLGIFGLAAYTAERRKKEIGVRKVLGATTYGITLMLSKNFIALVAVALLIASPIAWILMSQWLAQFHDRVAIPWWSFALAGCFALLLTLCTVGFQGIKAAIANPVDSLRDE